MIKFLGPLVLLRGRFDAMTTKEQASALRNLWVDAFLLMFLGAMIYVGLTRDMNAFYVWVPLLSFFSWIRFKQARERWKL